MHVLSWFHGISVKVAESHLWKSTIKRDHAQKFLWNQLFNNFFSKTVDLIKKCWFFRKNSNRIFDYFSTLLWEFDSHHGFIKNSVKSNFSSCTPISRNIFHATHKESALVNDRFTFFFFVKLIWRKMAHF